MNSETSKSAGRLAINDLYPDFTPKELSEAEENLKQYLALILRQSERLQANSDSYAHSPVLTER